MNKMNKKYFAIGGSLIVLLVILLIALKSYDIYYIEESPLYLAVSSYQESADAQEDFLWEDLQDITFPADSGEEIFLRGMVAFDQKDYATAKSLFIHALDAPSSDPALTAYLYFYINQCLYFTDGIGKPETVSLALDAAKQYAPTANDLNMLNDLIYSILPSVKDCEQVSELLEEYLDSTMRLELLTRVRLKNALGMLTYVTQEYSKSLQQFYDVELMLADLEMTPELESELVYAKEFIANLYYLFKDYETAALLYQEIVDTSPNDSFVAYGSYINMANAYLDIQCFEKSKEVLNNLEKLLPHMDADTRAELEACINDLYANICIDDGSYVAADIYLSKAEAYYENNEGTLFWDGAYFVKLTHCKYMFHTGSVEESKIILEEVLSSGEAASHGSEQDVYELLSEIYQITGEKDKLIQTYQSLFQLNAESLQTIQKEYLRFSKYYRESNQLRKQNSNLSRTNVFALLGIIATSGILCIILILFRALSKKNVTDQLTGVYNRKKLNHILQIYRHTGTPANLGVAMMDIDYFKRYNDTYGHLAGDKVLTELANVLINSVRSKDVVIRYGGEEFLILMNDVQAQTAMNICHRIQKQLKIHSIPHTGSEICKYITLSVGLCHQTMQNTASLEKLIEYADECLYQSKEAGRNRINVKTI